MNKLLAISLLGFSSLLSAQTVQTTPNLITSGTTHTWTGVTTGTIPSGCATAGPCPGGPTPIYDPATNTVSFSYNANAYVGQTIAINNALAGVGAGVKINGYNYSYQVRNMNGDDRQGGIDTFTVATVLRGPANSYLLSDTKYFNTKFDWTSYSGTKTATTPYNIADVSYLQIGITGGDNGYWGGYFGPQIRNVNMSLNYSVDPCATNPAYSPTCANYSTVSTQSVFSGVSGPQAYAINQALSGTGVMVHGFNYGYDYNVAGRQCSFFDIFGFCLTGYNYSDAGVATVITDNNNNTVFSESSVHNGDARGTSGTYSKQFRFSSSRQITTLGGFAMAPWTSGNASITNMYSDVVYTPDPCVTNPLSSTTCPGYQQAYTEQQCASNPLYSTQCVGYAAAYFTQQCNANQLYNQGCPGYAAAYLSHQCSINPLFSTTCAGYEQAYFNHQCSDNPLYNSACPGYAAAYFTQQCNLNGLYDRTCPNYSEAYAKKMLLEKQGLAETVATAGVVASTAPTTEVTTTPSSTGNTTVDKAIATPAPTANAAAAPAAPVQLVAPPPPPSAPQAQQEKKPEGKPEGGQPAPQMAQGPQGGEKPQPTARQQLAERRAEAAKKDAVEKGKNLANEMGKASNMEAQKAIQDVVVQAMGFTPGFDTYNKTTLPDTVGYKPFSIYNNQKTIDNRATLRMFGGSEARHTEMVDSQYKGN